MKNESVVNCMKEYIKPRRVFLSYGRDEYRDLAERIYADLENRGHEVWFDKDKIRSNDWEYKIERGLEWVAEDIVNNRFILLMTPYSVRRPDGFCLNELAMAAHKGIEIVPVMVVSCEVPLSICRLHYVDFRNCLPVETKMALYRESLKKLFQAIEDDVVETENFHSQLLRVLKPGDSAAKTSIIARDFIAREWLIAKVQDWMKQGKGSRIFWLTGLPGSGKSALTAKVAEELHGIGAIHFCDYRSQENSKPETCIKSIAFQLSTQLPEYQTKLDSIPNLGERINTSNVYDLFELLLTNPLNRINPPKEPIVVIIDGLDEAKKSDGENELADFIVPQFEEKTPDWLRLLVTSRPNRELVSNLEFDPIKLSDNQNDCMDDIRTYLKLALKDYRDDDAHFEAALNDIADKSEGIFMYVVKVKEGFEKGYYSMDKLDEIPRGMNKILENYIRNQFKGKIDSYDQVVRPVLSILSVAQDPLSFDFIGSIMEWNQAQKIKFSELCGSLIISDEDYLRFFHSSIIDWLTDEKRAKSEFYIDQGDGHRLIAEYGMRLYESQGYDKLPIYLINHLPTHILQAKINIDRDVLESLSEIYFRRGKSYFGQGRLSLAAAHMFNALKINEYLARGNPKNNRHSLAISKIYLELAKIERDRASLDNAYNYAESAEKTARILLDSEPNSNVIKEQLGISLYRLYDINARKNNSQSGERFIQEANAIAQELIELEPNNEGYLELTGKIYRILGLLFNMKGDTDKAKIYFEDYERIFQRLSEDSPDNPGYIRELAVSKSELAALFSKNGNDDLAIIYYQDAAKLFQNAAKASEMIDFRRDYALTLMDIVELKAETGLIDESRSLYQLVMKEYAGLVDDAPENITYLKDQANIFHMVSRVEFDAGNEEMAQMLEEKGFLIYKKMIEKLGNAETYLARGNAYMYIGKYDLAIEDYNQAIALNPQCIEAYVNRGQAYHSKGDIDKTVEDYTKALACQPLAAEVYYARGNVYFDKGEQVSAIADYCEAIKIQPMNPDFYVARGAAYEMHGESQAAIKDYNEAIKLKPEYALAYKNRSISYRRMGDHARAAVDEERAAELDAKYRPELSSALATSHDDFERRSINVEKLDPWPSTITWSNRSDDVGPIKKALQRAGVRKPVRRVAPLTFAPDCFLVESGRTRATGLYIVTPTDVAAMDLTNEPIYSTLGDTGYIRLNENNIIDYMRFFFHTVRGELGSFRLIEQADDLTWKEPNNTSAEQYRTIDGIVAPIQNFGRNEENRWLLKAYVQFKNALFKTDIFIDDQGNIELANEELIKDELHVDIKKAEAGRQRKSLTDTESNFGMMSIEDMINEIKNTPLRNHVDDIVGFSEPSEPNIDDDNWDVSDIGFSVVDINKCGDLKKEFESALNSSEDQVAIKAVQAADLPFYKEFKLYEIEHSVNGGNTIRYALYKPGSIRLLDWTNEPFYSTNEIDTFPINRKNIAAYAKFFFHSVRGSLGCFNIVEKEGDIVWLSGARAKKKAKVKELLMPVTYQGIDCQSLITLTCTVIFRDALFRTDIKIAPFEMDVLNIDSGAFDHFSKGQLQLCNEELLLEELRVPIAASPDENTPGWEKKNRAKID